MAVTVGAIYLEIDRALRENLSSGWERNALLAGAVARGRPGSVHRNWTIVMPTSDPRDGRRRIRTANEDGSVCDHEVAVIYGWNVPVGGEVDQYAAALTAEGEVWTALAETSGQIVGTLIAGRVRRFWLSEDSAGPATLIVEMGMRCQVLTTLVEP